MSTSLAFWKDEDGVELDHSAVYQRVIGEGKEVEGLQFLPISAIMNAVKTTFSDWEWLDESSFEHETRGAVSVYTTAQAVQFDCYSLSGDDMNRLIDLMAKFGCPLYDPQIEVRFDGKS